MDTPLISVIVPVYKVEAYLDRCVQSIVDQTYRNLEIILVDDGSPDNCGAMCDAWAQKDGRIKVIHKENGGLSDARNAGMAVVSGEYIGFIDSDDYIAPEMFRLLYDRLCTDGSDIATCGVETVFEDGTPSRPLTPSGCIILNREEALEAILRESWLKQPVWYKLYRTDLIRNLPFPVGKYHEDVYWTWQAVARAEKVSVFDVPCYFYVQRSGSIMGESYSLRRLDAIEAKCQRLKFLRKEYPELTAAGQIDLLFSCMYHGQLALKALPKKERNQAFAVLEKAVAQCGMPVPEEMKKLPFTHRCWLWLEKVSIPLVCWLRNISKIGI